MHEEVWCSIINKSFDKSRHLLSDYSAMKLKNRVYPGLIRNKGAITQGIIYNNISKEDILKLDHFEGKEYRRIQIRVNLNGMDKLETYLYIGPSNNILNEKWSFDDFKTKNLNSFMNHFRGWNRF